MDAVKNLTADVHNKWWYGFVVILSLILIFLRVYSLKSCFTERLHGNNNGIANNALSSHNGSGYWNNAFNHPYMGGAYTDALGGPPGASYSSVKDNTGASGDWCCYDTTNHADMDLALSHPEIYLDMYAPESFMTARQGPQFTVDSAAMTQSLVAPLYAKWRAEGSLSQPPAVNETMVDSNGREGMCVGTGISHLPDGHDSCNENYFASMAHGQQHPRLA